MKNNKVNAVVSLIQSVIKFDNKIIDIETQVNDLGHAMNKIIAGLPWDEIKPIILEAGEQISSSYQKLQFKMLARFCIASFPDTKEGGEFARAMAKILCERLFGQYTSSHRSAMSQNLSETQRSDRAGGREKGTKKKRKVDLLAKAVKAFEALTPADKAKFLKALK